MDAPTPTPPPPSADTPTPTGSLRKPVLRGLAWMMGQTVIGRLVGLVSQLLLVYLLLPEEFGLVGLAYTVSAVFSFASSGSAGDLLVQRYRQWNEWVGPVFWFTFALGLVLALGMSVAAPFAAAAYGEPQVTGLVLVVASVTLVNALSVVPQAKLRSEMAFATLAKIGLVTAVAGAVFSISLAWLGFGAYSLVGSLLLVALCRLAVLWWAADTSIPWSLGWSRWPTVAVASTHLMLAEIALIVMAQCDYVFLGLSVEPEEVGLYYVAFNLSTQTLRLISVNILSVMQPVFSSTQEDFERQRAVFMQSLRVMLGVGLPMCAMQAAGAGPVVRLLFPEEFQAVALLIAILSLGMGPRLVTGLAMSVMKGNGRFALFNGLTWCGATLFLLGVAIATAAETGSVGVAVAIALGSCIYGPAAAWAALRSMGSDYRGLVSLLVRPVITAAVSVGGAELIARLIAISFETTTGDVLHLVTLALLSPILYFGVGRYIDPMMFRELRGFAKSAFARIRPSAAPDR